MGTIESSDASCSARWAAKESRLKARLGDRSLLTCLGSSAISRKARPVS